MGIQKQEAEKLQIAFGGKKTKDERTWIEQTAERLQQTPTWVVTQAIRSAMKNGIEVKS